MEFRPSLFSGTDADVSMVVESNVFDDCQSDSASALFFSGGRYPVEAFEDTLPVFFRNAAAEIADAEVDQIPGPAGGKFNALCPAVNDCIGNQIVQSLEEKLGVSLELV